MRTSASLLALILLFGVVVSCKLSERLMGDKNAGTVSALWNLAYDAGLGVGAAGFGLVAAQTGYPIAFALTAALMLTALVPAMAGSPAPLASAPRRSAS